VTVTLIQVIRDFDFLDQQSTVFAAKPWTADSQAIVARVPDGGGLPEEAQELGLTYFLEVAVARKHLRAWAKGRGRDATLQEQCARLIQYAITGT
jgi:hypothetical protein